MVLFKRPLRVLGVSSAIALIAVAIILGVTLSRDGHHEHDEETEKDSDKSTKKSEPLSAYDWTSPTEKAYGVALGNWLLLERWMDEDWFTSTANEDVYDEWGWCEAVAAKGDNVTEVLQERFNHFIVEGDIQDMYQAGVKQVRIPIGFWALIPTEEDEPYVNAGQLGQIDRILPWLHTRGMRVIFDLHGLPGSQNGAQPSGHNSSDLFFYSPEQQKRSDATVQAALDYMAASPYSSTFSALAICNEPTLYEDNQLETLKAFYERSYTVTSAAKMPMIWHHAFQEYSYWNDFIEGKDPSLLIMEDHPYPGNFPSSGLAEDIMSQVCANAKKYQDLPLPVIVSEWSLMTGILDREFMSSFYQAQATAWDWSAGSIFWSWKASPSKNPVLSNSTNWDASSMFDLLQKHVIPTTTMREGGYHTQQLITGMNQTCGVKPEKAWASPITLASGDNSSSDTA